MFLAACGLSLVAESGGYFLVVVASPWGASLVVEQSVELTGFSSCGTGLVALRRAESSQTGDQTHISWQVNSRPLCYQGSPLPSTFKK